MEMDRTKAAQLWNMLCTEEIGVDSDGDVVERPTRLGIAMQSRGLPTYLWYPERNEKDYLNVADFLSEFAEALRSGDK